MDLLRPYPAEMQGRAYVSGESYRYLGRQYRVKVQRGEPTGVRLQRDLLQVTVPMYAGADEVGVLSRPGIARGPKRYSATSLTPALRAWLR